MSIVFYKKAILFLACILVTTGCKQTASETISTLPNTPPLLTLLSADQTHIDFSNTLTEGLNTNVMVYEYFYNGGGVAVGDVNGDGLEDIYFTGNMVPNRLYLNKGNLQFEDITIAAKVAGRPGPWKTGVTMADVNGDGKLDIYVCYSGNLRPEKRTNELFINQGVDAQGIPIFLEQASEYGLNSAATSTQATFFDYDRDNDLDMVLINHNLKLLPVLDQATTASILKKDDPMTGVRLFRNTNGMFSDITEKAGISSSALTYGLGIAIADVNQDGWPDMYISNDYTVADYLYINQGNGTFSDQLRTQLGHTSQFSMGNAIADVNNDALPDIFTLDMLPEDNKRQKLLFAPDNYDKFDLVVNSGFHYQYMRNMLQLSNGNASFSEVGQLAGISNTDWSWAPLFADLDNDGWKDLFVTNGYLRDYTNMDFVKYMDDIVHQKGRLQRNDVWQLINQMPSSQITDYVFRNQGNLTFSKENINWGITKSSNSNGAAYTDLDNDGDLDLVVNTLNQPATIYRNEASQQTGHHYLPIKLVGSGKNTQGIGAKVTLYIKGNQQYLEQMPTQGFQSSVSPILHFGLGSETLIDSLRVVWPDAKQQLLRNVKSNQLLTLTQQQATDRFRSVPSSKSFFQSIPSPVTHTHQRTFVNDFKRQLLLPNALSFSGPCMAKADVNGDQLEDVYVGGGNGQTGALYIQQPSGSFQLKKNTDFAIDQASEDTDALFFDADHDGDTDLYVASGGYGNYAPEDTLLQDRLYFNDGAGNFIKQLNHLPRMLTSSACVRAADINGDQHLDLFVGGRVIPGRYPETPTSYILINDGKGRFADQTRTVSPPLQKPGMVTDAAWTDVNGDTKPDLIVVGEWMPILVMINQNGKLTDQSHQYFGRSYNGFWNKLLVDDLTGDGKPDLVIGNLGLNSQCTASDQFPTELYYKDFDANGTVDPILCLPIQGKSYPYMSRDELLEQISSKRALFTSYASYSQATLTDVFTQSELKDANHLKANYLKTALFIQTPTGKFQESPLPLQVQFSPVFAIAVVDYNKDGIKDLILSGNSKNTRLRFGKYDANYGLLLTNTGQGKFQYVPQFQSGFKLTGDIRSVITVGNKVLFGTNQHVIQAYQLR